MLKLKKQQINKKHNKFVALQSCQTFSTHQHQSTSTTSSTSINHNNNNITKHSKSKRIKPIKLSLTNNQNRTLDQLLQSIHLSTPIIPTTLTDTTTATKSTSTKTKSILRTKSKPIHSRHHSLHSKQQHNRHQPQYQQQFSSSKFTKRQSIFSFTKFSFPSTTTSFRTFSASNHDSAFPTSFQDSITSLSSSPSTFSSLTKSAAFLRLSIVDVDIFLSNDKIPNHDLILPLLVTELQSIADEVPKVNYSITTTETNPLNNVATLILANYTDITGNYKCLIEQAQFSHDKAIKTLRRIYPNSDPTLENAITEIKAKIAPVVSIETQNTTAVSSSTVLDQDTFAEALQYVTKTDIQNDFDFEELKPFLLESIRHLLLFFNDPEVAPLIKSFMRDPHNKNNNNLQQIQKHMQNWTTFVSEVNLPTTLTGRASDGTEAPLEDHLNNKNVELDPDELDPDAALFYIPKYQYTSPLDPTEIFSTPQQLVLLYGTICHLLITRQRQLKYREAKRSVGGQRRLKHREAQALVDGQGIEVKINDCDKIEQLITELLQNGQNNISIGTQLTKDDILSVFSTCHSLTFLNQQSRLILPTCVVGGSGTGKSHLYLYLCKIFHKLDVSFVFVTNDSLVEGIEQPVHWFHSGFVYKQNKFLSFTIPDLADLSALIDDVSIMLVDLNDFDYSYEAWQSFSQAMSTKLASKYSTIFTFSSGGKSIHPPFVKEKHSNSKIKLVWSNIFPFYFAPSMNNYNIGMIKLHFYRYFKFHIEQYLSQPSKLQQQEYVQQILTNQAKLQDEYSNYFGTTLSQLIDDYQQQFCSILLELTSQQSSSQFPLTNITTIQQTLLSRINSQLINNEEYRSFYNEIISHPVISLLSIQQEISSAKKIQLTLQPRNKNYDGRSDQDNITPTTTTSPSPVPNILQSLTESIQLSPTNNNKTNVDNNSYIVPTFLAVPKHMTHNTDITSIHNKWIQFENSTAPHQQSQQQLKQPPLTLFESIHHFWHDFSIFNTFGTPNTRVFSFLSTSPTDPSSNTPPEQYTHHSINKSRLATFRSSHFKPRIDPYRAKFVHIDRGYIQYQQPIPLNDTISLSTSFGFEINYINTLLQIMEKNQCYLPFDGFNRTPISKVISHNEFSGIPMYKNNAYENQVAQYLAHKKVHKKANAFDFFKDDFFQKIEEQPNDSTYLYIPPATYEGIDFLVYSKGYDSKIGGFQLSAGSGSYHPVTLPIIYEQIKSEGLGFEYLYLTTEQNPRLPFLNIPHLRLTNPICSFNSTNINYDTYNYHIKPNHPVFEAQICKNHLTNLLSNDNPFQSPNLPQDSNNSTETNHASSETTDGGKKTHGGKKTITLKPPVLYHLKFVFANQSKTILVQSIDDPLTTKQTQISDYLNKYFEQDVALVETLSSNKFVSTFQCKFNKSSTVPSLYYNDQNGNEIQVF